MTNRRNKIYLLLFVISLVFVLTTIQCDAVDNVSYEEAIQLVLDEVVKPDDLDNEVIVFSLTEPLQPGDLIGPYNKEGYPDNKEPTQIQEETWFFWIDDEPGAHYIHTNRFVYVSRANGQVNVSEELWWPVLNGEGLWIKTTAYWDETNWVYSNVNRHPTYVEHSGIKVRGVAPPVQRNSTNPEEAPTGYGIVLNLWEGNDPTTEADDEGAKKHFEANGDKMHDLFTRLLGEDNVTYLGPPEDTNPKKDGENDIETRVTWFYNKSQEMKPSQTLLVYVAGHGYMKEDGEGVIGDLYEDFFKDFDLSNFDSGVHMIIILQSCQSGSFVDGVSEFADVTLTSTDAFRSSWTDDDEWGSEYTNTLEKAIQEILDDPAKLGQVGQQAHENETNVLEELFWNGHQRHYLYDEDALLGFTFPQAARQRWVDEYDEYEAVKDFEDNLNAAIQNRDTESVVDMLQPIADAAFFDLNSDEAVEHIIDIQPYIQIVGAEKLAEDYETFLVGEQPIDTQNVHRAKVDFYIDEGKQSFSTEYIIYLIWDGSSFKWANYFGVPILLEIEESIILEILDPPYDFIDLNSGEGFLPDPSRIPPLPRPPEIKKTSASMVEPRECHVAIDIELHEPPKAEMEIVLPFNDPDGRPPPPSDVFINSFGNHNFVILYDPFTDTFTLEFDYLSRDGSEWMTTSEQFWPFDASINGNVITFNLKDVPCKFSNQTFFNVYASNTNYQLGNVGDITEKIPLAPLQK